ncbi:ABC transporter ATP-binding protein [Variovorax sp. KK3]|uniref:ABC transporter ATP-binding protein n=1 Tax=Variovorax sp. KK3 TaxID=1855728 RepID=UPI00097C381C|nr:ABC transporter ATP-binding protein [Variovorax sp. KK3]
MPKLEIEGLRVTLGKTPILQGVSTSFEEGEIVVLLGPSGCGKTTLLRSIAGLEHPTSGRIVIDGVTVYDSPRGIDLPSERRNLGLVFQSYALWPHKTVFENVAYALRLRRMSEAQIRTGVDEVLAGIGLDGMAGRYPHQLSGGQQQRVALARSMAYSPPVLLLDEPLSNLDAKLREDARIWIRSLIKSRGLSAIFVTHDQVEAMAIADRIVLMDAGQIAQSGSPEELYGQPASLFAAEFMGANNHLRTIIADSGLGEIVLAFGDQSLKARGARAEEPSASTGVAVIRVEAVGSGPPASDDNVVQASLETAVYLGGKWEAVYVCGGQRLRAFSAQRPQEGCHALHIPRDAVWFFPDPSQPSQPSHPSTR